MTWTRWLAGASLQAIAAAMTTGGLATDAMADNRPFGEQMRPARYDWRGFYIGVHAGYGDVDNDGFFATSVDLSFGGGQFLGGGQVGWNWQHGGLLFGVEADISGLDWQDVNLREERYIAQADYLTTLRGRVGWTEGNVLFYVTGGLAYLKAKVTTSSGGLDPDQQGNTDSKGVSTHGGVAGVGIEWGLTRNLSVRAEGLHLFFDERKSLANLIEGCRPGVVGCLNTGTNFFSIDDGFVFQLGANWRFGGASAEAMPQGALAPYAGMPGARYNWSGFYLGPVVGYGKINTGGTFLSNRVIEASGNPAFVDLNNLDNRGLLAGGQAGYNWQLGSIVLGIEGDIAGVDWDDLFKDLQVPETPVAVAFDLDFLATARGRLGWAVDNWLIYATGGFLAAGGANSFNFDATGRVVGGGVEWGLTPNLSVKGDGLYLVVDKTKDLTNLVQGVPGDKVILGDGFVARVGANWRFGAYAATVPSDDKDLAAHMAAPGAGYNWRGIYVGVQVGDGGLVTDGIFNPFDVPSETINLQDVNDLGVLGGGQIGSNWQRGSLVFGVEGDIAAVNWDGRQAEFAHPGQAIEFDSDFLATARGRIGWAPDNLLFYVTGGFAFLNASLDNTSNNGGRVKSVDTVGGVAGLGMEWGVTSRVSLKVEGDFVFFDDTTSITNLGSEGDPGDFFRIDDGFVARLGLNWRMGPAL